MKSISLAFLAVPLFLVVQADRRSDDVDMSALQRLVENQAATIQNLQARLDAQDSKIQQQDAKIQQQDAKIQQQESLVSSLQTTQQNHSSQISTIQSTQRKSAGFLADMSYQPNIDVVIEAGDIVKFNNIISNAGGGYDNVTGIFTAPYTGLYAFHLQFVGGNHYSYTLLGIYEGNHRRALAMAEGDDYDHNDQGEAFAVFHTTQGTEVSVKLNGGVGKIWGSVVTSFAGALLHAD